MSTPADFDPNPFRPPQVASGRPAREVDPEVTKLRRRATLAWAMAMMILVFPAINNYLLFETLLIEREGGNNPQITPVTLVTGRIFNLTMIGLAFVLSCFLGTRLLETVTRWIHRFFGASDSLHSWYRVLYQIMRQTIWFAVAAALTWKFWLANFYVGPGQTPTSANQLNLILATITGHLIAAGLYVQLLFGWYNVERQRPA